MDNLIVKDLETLGNLFENFFNQTGISRDESYMYMYSDTSTGMDYFKNSITRKYIKVREVV